MLQKIFDIKKLFRRHKQEAHVSRGSVHGIRCILHVANLALFGVVIILTIASALIYYLMPVTGVSEQSKMIEVQEVETTLDIESVNVDSRKEEVIDNATFSIISKRNVFSRDRKEWVVKAVIPKAPAFGKKKQVKRALAKKRAMAGKPKKIILHGIIIAGGIKKALINNPLKGVSKKKTLYIQEGDELEGYKVTSIEKDRIKLDWHGEEIVIMLYSGLKGFEQSGNADKVKPGGLTKLEYKYKVVEAAQAEERFHAGNPEDKKVAYADMLDETSHNLVYKGPECFFMPALDGVQLSGAVKMQEIAETFSDIEFKDVGFPEEEKRVVKAEIPRSVDLPTDRRLRRKAFSGKPTDIILHGIVIVSDIERDFKKALVNIPMSGSRKDRTLYVGVGDGLVGYKVTSIEKDRIKLDWHGEEMVVKFPPL